MPENITIYSFYNNKGGVGKTTLCQNAASLYAEINPKKQVLIIDLCPQANISQFFLGGGHVGYEKSQRIQAGSSRRNIVGFIDWILKGNSRFSTTHTQYSINVSKHNSNITNNLYLIAGDSFLESLSLALNYAVINPANINAWSEYMTAIKRMCACEFKKDQYESLTVFIDCNPSFSIYTQMGLVSSDHLIVPMMADYSSLEGIKGIMMLLFAKYPSAAVKNYADTIITFNRKISEHKLELPKFYEFVFNNFTSNLGVAKAFEAVRSELIDFCFAQWNQSNDLFCHTQNPIKTQKEWESEFVSNVKDFHTVGKISSSLGIPMHRIKSQTTYTMPDGTTVKPTQETYFNALEHINKFAKKIN